MQERSVAYQQLHVMSRSELYTINGKLTASYIDKLLFSTYTQFTAHYMTKIYNYPSPDFVPPCNTPSERPSGYSGV
jgi:hypothetical protein